MGVLAAAVPADYDELWRSYGGYLEGLARKLGVSAQEAPDVTSAILERLIRADVIGQYQPGYTVEHQGKAIQVSFKAFLSSQFARRVLGHRDRLARLARREPLLCDREQDGAGTLWVELFGGQWWDDYSGLSTTEFFTRMRTWLALQPPPDPADRCDLLALFDELVREVTEEGKVSLPTVRERFHISQGTCKVWLGRLREAITAGQDDTAPPLPQSSWVAGGVTLGIPEVRAAITVLENARGIMVRQPLEKAGHPLKDAAAGWYHPFAREEIKLYPGIAIDPQTHKKPAGHVKIAVLHRFRRMLAESLPSPDPEPEGGPAEPDASPWDLIEAELWRLGADSAKVDYVRELVDQLAAVPA